MPLKVSTLVLLANKQAQKAIEKAGKEGIEAGIGALIDITTMNSVIKSANMIYYKRFLFEKDHRIELLKSLKSEEILEAEVIEEIIEDEKNI